MAIKVSPLQAGWILLILHLASVAGFLLPQTSAILPRFIWVNILFTLIVLLSFHKKWSREFVFSILLLAASGFLLDVLAVQTGLIFGAFKYGSVLGYSIWGTPIIMAASWVIILYCSRQIAEMIAKDAFLVSILSSLFMVLLDYFMEPFAAQTGMWYWNSGRIPMHNYIGSFVCGILFQYLFIRSVKMSGNKLALPIYLIQLGFFIAFFLLNK